eukprot:UN02293
MSKKNRKKAAPKKSNKKPKDINAPKRSQSSYFLFMNERRPILRQKHTGKSMTDISKLISAEWKKITGTDKTKYNEKAAVLKEKYKKDLDIYKQSSNFRRFEKKLKKWKEEQKDLKLAQVRTKSN